MTTTSGTPSETIQAEMDAVLQEGLRVAADYLERFDTFIPFALLFREDDKLERIEVKPTDGSTELDSQQAYETLVSSLGERAARLHAVGVVSDVTLSREGEDTVEAVRIELEHRDAGARVLAAWATYTRDETGQLTFADQLGTSDIARRVWI